MKSIIITIGILLSGITTYAQSEINYAYDKQGRLISEHYESVYLIELTYDKEGNFISKAVTNYTGISSLKKQQNESTCKVYPNPVNNMITIENTEGDIIRSVRLTDMVGRELLVLEGESAIIYMDLKSFPGGEYHLTIETASGSGTMLIIKQ